MPKVSVIIAVYGAEKYIEKCARSLFEQTLDDIEYIFVDDCTPDKSMEVLESVIAEYPYRKSQVKIIHNQANLKLGSTRRVGFIAASGEYIISCDPDDWIEHNMYELLYNKAIEDKADIVVCDFFHEYSNNTAIEHYEPITPPILCINMSIQNNYWWTLCNRLISHNFIDKHQLLPMPGLNYLEDIFMSIRCYCLANSISYVPIPLYHYRRNNESSILNTSSIRYKYEQRRLCFDALDKFIHP
ncbi:MAG: glycosyltransferase family 2 protein [Muribaculaceae bacterium]